LEASQLIRTLSTNNPLHYGIIQGLLYVPELPESSPCGSDVISLIPVNVTTLADFPSYNYPFIGIAPWTTAPCVSSYLASMRASKVRGAIFFHPNNSTAQPPPVSDPSWSLGDGGQWKSANDFPVYAISGMLGSFILDELAQYSGNMSQVPYGTELVQIYDPQDSIRLYARMDVSNNSGIPSLWVFLIIVLAILLAVVLITSLIMRLIQRRHRMLLQRRVASGEVDLEALGIKRLKVPQEHLDKMPQYTFTSRAEATDPAHVSETATRQVPFSQPTCPICLDDFVDNETIVRELPCNHIFHPECIDPFLRDNSSLCPMCKKSALPPGYCPVEVTNLMVRRERLIRRMRQRVHQTGAPPTPSGRFSAAMLALHRRMHRESFGMTEHRRASSMSHALGSELHTMVRNVTHHEAPPPEVEAQGAAARRAWRRERLAREQARTYDEQENTARAVDVSRPLCKLTDTNLATKLADESSGRRIAGRIIPSLE